MKFYAMGSDRLTEGKELNVLGGVVAEHLFRQCSQGCTVTKAGNEVDFAIGGVRVEVKGGSASLRDLKLDGGCVMSYDEFDSPEEKAMIPASVFDYLISEDRAFYLLTRGPRGRAPVL